MSRILKRKTIIIVAVTLAFFGTVLKNANVYADGNDKIYEKAFASSLLTCYSDSFQPTVLLVKTSGKTGYVYKDVAGLVGDKMVPVPNTYDEKGQVKCSNLVNNLLKKKEITIPNGTSGDDKKSEFLQNMGYEISSSSTGNGQCVYFNYSSTYNMSTTEIPQTLTDDVTTKEVCATSLDNGKINVDTLEIKSIGGSDDTVVKFNSKKGKLEIKKCEVACNAITFEKGKTSWDTFVDSLKNELLSKNSVKNSFGFGYSYEYKAKVDNFVGSEPYNLVSSVFTLKNEGKGVGYLLGTDYSSAPKFSEGEIFVLYQNYLVKYFGANKGEGVVCPDSEDGLTVYRGSAKKNQGWYEIRYYDGKEIKNNCFAKANDHNNSMVSGVNNGAFTKVKNNCDFNCVATWLKNSKVTTLPSGVDLPTETSKGRTEEEEDSDKTCRNQGGAKSLGWVLCSILEFVGGATDSMYEEIVEPNLQIKANLFTTDGVSAQNVPYEGWSTFRDIANVIFVILLMVVIFSQLTGVGIDNYGIKKILPKLIIAAILINLSYLICLILVDISNIVGNGFQALFETLGRDLSDSVTISDAVNSSDGSSTFSGTGTIVGVGIFASLAVMVGTIWMQPMIIISLLVSGLGVIISIVFLLFLLVVRQAAIIVLVVLSPIAVVCYTLPNTKTIFDKWTNLFKTLLLVYPIAGLLVGGGNYVSKLILSVSDGSFSLALTAILAGIVPIFFLPNVVKSAFKMMGNLGATISGFGKTVGSGTTKRIRGSGIYQNMQQSSTERAHRIKGGLDKDGRPSTGFRRVIGNIASGSTRSRQRNALQYQREISERGSLESANSPNFMLETLTDNEKKRINSSPEANSLTALRGGLLSALRSGNTAQIRAYTDVLSARGDHGRDAVKGAYNEAVRPTDGAPSISNDAAQAFASNLIANHTAEYKDNNRSLYEIANGVNNNEAGYMGATTDDYINNRVRGENGTIVNGRQHLMASSKAGTMGTMDDGAFDETFFDQEGNVNFDGLTDEQIRALGLNADNALQHGDKTNARRNAGLQRIVDAAKSHGYQPRVQEVRIVNNGGGGTNN
ncbi:hypothetical protein IKD82_01770 [Candidatus Saccharibacteria bacterium]|nr:hypothetical protein [Candidatus Saccharibacteria bacterium]